MRSPARIGDESGGAGKLLALGLAIFLLPVFAGVAFRGAFELFRKPEEETAKKRPVCAEGPDSPCAAVLRVIDAATQADTEGLRAGLSDPRWLETVPPAATASSDERGQLYLRMLLREPPATLEELKGSRYEITSTATETALDGQRATVRVGYRRAGERWTAGEASMQLERSGGGWRVVAPKLAP